MKDQDLVALELCSHHLEHPPTAVRSQCDERSFWQVVPNPLLYEKRALPGGLNVSLRNLAVPRQDLVMHDIDPLVHADFSNKNSS